MLDDDFSDSFFGLILSCAHAYDTRTYTLHCGQSAHGGDMPPEQPPLIAYVTHLAYLPLDVTRRPDIDDGPTRSATSVPFQTDQHNIT